MSQRIEKINELLKQELSTLFVLDFPGEIITINFIHTSSDLSYAKVFVSVSSNHESVYEGLKKNSGEYRKILADKLFLRKMPRLDIARDTMRDEIENVEKLLDQR